MNECRDEAVFELARRLYWNMERLDPGPEYIPWSSLTDAERDYYCFLVDDLTPFNDLVEKVLNSQHRRQRNDIARIHDSQRANFADQH